MIKRRASLAFAFCATLMVDHKAVAVELTLNLVPSQSMFTLDGSYGGNVFLPQDDTMFPTSGTTDGDLTRPSNQPTFQGTITVDVDNVLAPTTIQILSSSIDAESNGSWLPTAVPGLEDAPGCNIGAGQTDRCSSANPPDPASPADFSIKLVAFGFDFAYGAVRNLNYNLKTEVDPDGICDDNMCPLDFEPVVEPVNAQGEFSSLSQHLSYNTGYFDTWQDPLLDDDRDRDVLDGDSLAINQHEHSEGEVKPGVNGIIITPFPDAPKSTYVVSGNVATLTIPVKFDLNASLSQFVNGQFVATVELMDGGLTGDHNDDGIVDARDYVFWRKSNINGEQGYLDWRSNFGKTSSASGVRLVPEPAGACIAIFATLGVCLSRHPKRIVVPHCSTREGLRSERNVDG